MTSSTEPADPSRPEVSHNGIEDATILVADDSSDDIELLRRALKKAGLGNPVKHVTDGNAAIAFLQEHAVQNDPSTWPLLMFLDLNMPCCNGFGVLEWLRKQPGFRDLPTIVFSNSEQPSHIQTSLGLGAHGYWVKPCRFEDLVRLMVRLKSMLGNVSKRIEVDSPLLVAA